MTAPLPPPPRVLLIGYGNPHRQDDRAGHVVAETVRVWAARENRSHIHVLTAYQLDLDMVNHIRAADVVYFSDAHVLSFSDEILITPVKAAKDHGFTTHLITPSGLFALCSELYQHTPRGTIVSVPGEWFDMGDEMSPRAAQKAAAAAAHIIQAIASLHSQ